MAIKPFHRFSPSSTSATKLKSNKHTFYNNLNENHDNFLDIDSDKDENEYLLNNELKNIKKGFKFNLKKDFLIIESTKCRQNK
eukprot:Pgem_evm1s13694